MKTKLLLLSGALFASSTMLFSQFIPGQDQFIGGNPTGSNPTYNTDVIGNPSVFEIHGATVSYGNVADDIKENDTMTIRIFSEYFDNLLSDSKLLGTVMGDLFITTTPVLPDLSGNPATINDIVDNDAWTHVVDLTGAKGSAAASTTADLFELGASPDFKDSTEFGLSSASGIFREEQVVEYLTGGTDVGDATVEILDVTSAIIAESIGSGFSVGDLDNQFDFSTLSGSLTGSTNEMGETIGTNDKYLEITLTAIPDSLRPVVENGAIVSGQTLGFQWAMTCANDIAQWTIENDLTPVPEPATVALLTMLGLGYIVYRRRKHVVVA